MPLNRARRKLSGILTADAVGYSRMMQDDEAETIRAIEDNKQLMQNLIEQFGGRVVDAPGDNLLAEFDSVVDAVECAVDIQKTLNRENSHRPRSRKMQFRIGINLGDVVEKAGSIYGDGVNIAARIERLAEPGGICISRTAYDQVKNKLELGYAYLGEHDVKNISEPVRVYQVLTDPSSAGVVIGEKRFSSGRKRNAALAFTILLAAAAVAIIGWDLHLRYADRNETASLERMAHPLPDKPSIAVLPFDNLNDGGGHDYFSDGITEEIITALSKVPYLHVIARYSTFYFRELQVKPYQVAERLGVRYVLQGSVRRKNDRVRIAAKLIDAVSGRCVWAERYEGGLEDIFALQDEITLQILTALQVRLTVGEAARLGKKGTDSVEAYIKVLQGLACLWRNTRSDNMMARNIFLEAAALDPDFAEPYGFLALTHLADVWFGSGGSPQASLKQAFELAGKSIALDDSLALNHVVLGQIYNMGRQHEKSIAEGHRAIAIAPNLSDAYLGLAISLCYAGRADQSIDLIKKAIRLNPIPPAIYHIYLGHSYRLSGRYNEALASYRKAAKSQPDDIFCHIGLAATLILLGHDEDARAEALEVLRIKPDFSLDQFARTLPFKDRADADRYTQSLRKAGLK